MTSDRTDARTGDRADARTGTGRPATIGDVAAAAGVSRATVSRVMNGRDTVDAALAERVLTAAQRLSYSPSTVARSLSLGVTRTIGVLVPDLQNPMFQQVLTGVTRAAAADGYDVLVADSREQADAEQQLARAVRRRTDALVLCAPRADDDALSALVAELEPVVVVNRRTAGAIAVDYAGGVQALAEHLHGLGHRRIAYLAGPARSFSNAARLAGLGRFADAHPDAAVTQVPCGPSMEDGYAAAEPLLATDATAAVVFNDVAAIGLLGRLRELGVVVPDELSVTGFDDVMMSRFSSPPLTTMAVPQPELGESAWTRLRGVMQGDPDATGRTFEPALVVRSSTGRPAPS